MRHHEDEDYSDAAPQDDAYEEDDYDEDDYAEDDHEEHDHEEDDQEEDDYEEDASGTRYYYDNADRHWIVDPLFLSFLSLSSHSLHLLSFTCDDSSDVDTLTRLSRGILYFAARIYQFFIVEKGECWKTTFS